MKEINTLIRQRRSVFQAEYTGAKVDDAVINQMLENAVWAPTHKMTEPWRFIVYAGDGLKVLAELQASYYKEYTIADGSFKEDRYQNLLTKPLLSSHIIAVFMKRDDRLSVPEIEEAGAVFCAIQNMYLTATAYGVGCYLSTGGITYFDGAPRIFGFCDDDRLIGFLHVGVPKATLRDSKRTAAAGQTKWVNSR